MRIVINQRPCEIADHATIEMALALCGYDDAFAGAVAVNGSVVSRTSWKTYPLMPEDQLWVVSPMQGG